MKCKKCQPIIEKYLENELEPKLADEFEAHVRGCEKCQKELSLSRKIVRFLNQMPDPDVPEEIRTELLEKIKQSRSISDRINHMLHSWRGLRSTIAKWSVVGAVGLILLTSVLSISYYLQHNSIDGEDYMEKQVQTAVKQIKFALGVTREATLKAESAIFLMPEEATIEATNRKALNIVKRANTEANKILKRSFEKSMSVLSKTNLSKENEK